METNKCSIVGSIFPILELTPSKISAWGKHGRNPKKRAFCLHLHGKHAKGIQFIVPMDLAPV
jgi:hypothetical protein